MLEEALQSSISAIQAHPFLDRCRKGTITRKELHAFIAQHGLYGTNFTRYLCALMSNLPDNSQVKKLAWNLFEELGFEDASTVPHSVIYQNMMKRLGVPREGVLPYPETQMLISTMWKHCRNPDPTFGLGALYLGAEALVPTMYSDIIAGLRSCGIAEGDLEFFTIHVACDDGHADTMREMMVDYTLADPSIMYNVIGAGRDMVEARLKFFTGIIERNRPVEEIHEAAQPA